MPDMKAFIKTTACLLLIFSLFSISCFAQTQTTAKQTRKQKRAAQEAAVSAFVKYSIDKKVMYIGIERICPQSMPASTTSDGYYIYIKHDTLSCVLPYKGVSRTPVLGNSDISITAINQPVTIEGGYNASDRSWNYSIRFINESLSEPSICTVQIYENAKVNARVDVNNRESISYLGSLNEKPETVK